jgi:hypothetical protein
MKPLTERQVSYGALFMIPDYDKIFCADYNEDGTCHRCHALMNAELCQRLPACRAKKLFFDIIDDDTADKILRYEIFEVHLYDRKRKKRKNA